MDQQEVKIMIKKEDLFDRYWNEQGKGIKHQYEVVEKEGEKLVIDHTTGLTWQQSGYSYRMTYADANEYIDDLNDNSFAGYSDWRLPTLEEAMSLIEPEKKKGDLYISEVFYKRLGFIWTADKKNGGAAWVVTFADGYCYRSHVGGGFVRPVR